ncbi:MAG TPA: hypothetical protein VKR60_06310 [Candidatus Sulfotelmatobacter sp.]|nr:hypothetical protein [Candidatus Sulfotelmatobacter sp.]
MSEKTRILFYALWIAHPVLQTVVAIVMLRRGLHRRFKFFFAYIATQALIFSLIFPSYLRHNYWAYFYLYWFSQAVSAVLGFQVIHEVFLDVFRPFHTLRDLGTVLFRWASLVMIMAAGVVAVSSDSKEIVPWMQAIITTQRCVRIVQVGIVLLLLIFARYLGVSRKQQSFGIALGFGSFALVELALLASWVGGHLGSTAANLVNMSVYNASLCIWMGYVLVKSPVREGSGSLLQTQRWEQSLTDIQHPLPEESLIPMFEGMVDRALSRTPSARSLAVGPARSKAESDAAPVHGFDLSGLLAKVVSKI